MFPTINSHNSWSKLEEVWLGDVYPASWYDHLAPEVRDCFYKITEITQQDLNAIQRKLEEFGVVVRRPVYSNIDDYLHANGQLIKPEITPRDYYLTLGNTLYAQKDSVTPWQHVLDEYRQQSNCTVKPVMKIPGVAHISSAFSVRAGRDVYIDLVFQTDPRYVGGNVVKEQLVELFKEYYSSDFKDYRVHILFNGGHVDGCFALLKPGVLLTSKYFDDYQRTFPNWQQVNVSEPEFKNYSRRRSNAHGMHKWYTPETVDNRQFNQHVVKYALDWVGDFTETFFEINCLSIDEKNVLMLGENEHVFRRLEELGITAHSVPFRTRTFWDGGMHCLTLDIRRQSKLEDLFPDRGELSLTVYK